MLWCFITTVLVATGSVLTADIKNENLAGSYVSCELPPYPDRGRYHVQGQPDDRPGQPFTGVVFINVTCDPDYAVDGPSVVLLPCYPEVDLTYIIRPCRRYCELPSHHSVDYDCSTRKGGATGQRPCETKVFAGTTVIPKCRPNYSGSPSTMRCTEGGWNYIARCAPECGRTSPQGQELIADRKLAEVSEVPWYAGIYTKTVSPFMHICGGSIVTTTAIITAAHCFWRDGEGRRSPELYGAAVGKIYRPWGDNHDVGAQLFDVFDIHLPDRFRGSAANFQNDIAIVILQTEIVYNHHIRPVCVSFDPVLNKRQLIPGNPGKVAGWGFTSEDSKISTVLQVIELPFVPFDKCYEKAPLHFREYITGDKLCAGFYNQTTLCRGYGGGGLAFPDYELGVQRYYLKGIVSVAPVSDGQHCASSQPTFFTEIIKHESWIQELLHS